MFRRQNSACWREDEDKTLSNDTLQNAPTALCMRGKLSTRSWEDGVKSKISAWSGLGSTSEIKRACVERMDSLGTKLLAFKGWDWLSYKLKSSTCGEHTDQHAISKGLEIVPFWVQERSENRDKEWKTNRVPFKWEVKKETNTATTHAFTQILKIQWISWGKSNA